MHEEAETGAASHSKYKAKSLPATVVTTAVTAASTQADITLRDQNEDGKNKPD